MGTPYSDSNLSYKRACDGRTENFSVGLRNASTLLGDKLSPSTFFKCRSRWRRQFVTRSGDILSLVWTRLQRRGRLLLITELQLCG